MNKRGVTLIELLGTIVIIGLVAGLVSIFVVLYVNATRRIETSQRANVEGLILETYLESEMQELMPTAYLECAEADCIILETHYAYLYDDVSTEISLNVYSPPLTMRLEFIDNRLYVDEVEYVIEGFTFADNSSVNFSLSGPDVIIAVEFVLVGESGVLFPFHAHYSFTPSEVPTP